MRKFYTLLLLLIAALANAQDLASFTASVSQTSLGCINTSQIPDTTHKKAYWFFGDGSVTITQALGNATHSYNAPGTYTVCLKIYHIGSTPSDTVLTASTCHNILIQTTTPTDSCHAQYHMSTTGGTAPLTVQFSNTSFNSLQQPVSTSYWNFGDGSVATVLSPSHVFTAPGTYNVCLTVTFPTGCSNTICHTLTVSAPPADSCHASFTMSASTGASPLVVQLAGQGSDNQQHPISSAVWNFGDGSSGTGLNATHTFLAGTHNVCLTVSFVGGCQSTVCHTVTVNSTTADSCHSGFSMTPTGGTAPLAVQLVAQGYTNQQSPITGAAWNFGDGSTGTGLSAVHTFLAGTYNVCVTVYFQSGCQSTTCHTLVVSAPPVDSCHTDFYVAPLSNTLMGKQFTAIGWNSAQHPISGASWNFGDGSSSTTLNPTHTYTTAGSYNVCLTLSFDGGCHSTICHQVIIYQPGADSCGANFTVNAVTATPLGRRFTALPWDSQQRPVNKVCWTFGDGHDTCVLYSNGGPNLMSVVHNYAAYGTYNVCVTIYYDGGCQSTTCHAIVVAPPIVTVVDSCRADFDIHSVSNDPLARSFPAIPWSSTQQPVTTVCWYFGDGRDTCINYSGTTAAYTVEHHYMSYGTYNVCVRIYYLGGCQSMKCKPVVVLPPPPPPTNDSCHVGINILPSTSANTLEKHFSVALLTNQTPTKVCWYFGDGSPEVCVVQPSPPTTTSLSMGHAYAHTGNYNVCIKVWFANGCIAYNCHNVEVTSSGYCSAFIHDTLVGQQVVLFNGYAFSSPGDSIVSYHWTFGDGTAANGQIVTHTYANGSNYQACLHTVSAAGCEATTCKSIHTEGTNQPTLILLPNPAITTLHATFYSSMEETVSVKMVNAYGMIVYSSTRYAFHGVNNWTFNVSTLPTGVYTFVIDSPHQHVTKIFVKQ